MFLGLRTVIYHAPDVEKAKTWYSAAFGRARYFDESFYVGFEIGGFELGLDPDLSEGPTGPGGTGVYWGVADAEASFARLLELGGREHSGVKDVGGGIKVASVLDPSGNVFGIIENPHFKIEGPALPNAEAH